MFPTEKWRIQSVMQKIMLTPNISLFQFWAPIKVNVSTFLSTADQPFAFYQKLDKSLSSYRKLCLDTLIPMDNYSYKKIPFGPPGRVFSRRLPEYNPNVPSYSAAEFPLLQTAIPLGIHSYYAFPVSNRHDQQCLGVFEIVSTQPSRCLPNLIMGLNFESVGLYIPNSLDILFGPSTPLEDERLDNIEGRSLKDIVHPLHKFGFLFPDLPLRKSCIVLLPPYMNVRNQCIMRLNILLRSVLLRVARHWLGGHLHPKVHAFAKMLLY
ncbi:protein NLP4-like isoform X1 [Solanum tuberosum]|uniref:protein NLP4-like isoform X1 n=1 Tax=Solanum tuberosum TaxID=4113 RepID=UPI00073A0F8E|nr:PREDICTED: protein NLP4-like isoform X1 [Solanum tuberosum]